MSLLAAAGAETGHYASEGGISGSTAANLTTQTTPVKGSHTRARSFRCASNINGTSFQTQPFVTTAGRWTWAAADFYLPTSPGRGTATATILRIAVGSGTWGFEVRLGPTGDLMLFNALTGLEVGLIGSRSTLPLDTWVRVELGIQFNSAALDNGVLWVNDVKTHDASADLSASALPTAVTAGWVTQANTATGTTRNIHVDNLTVSDEDGINGPFGRRPSRVYVAHLIAKADITRDAGWLAGAGGTTSLFDALDNIPPTGVALASATNTSQIKNGAASTTDNYDAEVEAYDTVVPAGSRILGVAAAATMGSSSNVGTNPGHLSLRSNPSDGVASATQNIVVETNNSAAGAWPTNWGLKTSTWVMAPTVVQATRPQVRVGRRDTANTHMATQLGAFIAYDNGKTVDLPLLDAAPTLYAPTVTIFEDNDPGTVDDSITGTVYINGETVRSVSEVRLYVAHSDTSHLLVTLKPPDGSPEVTLFSHRGSGANIGASAGSPLILRDDAATTLVAGFTSGTAGQTLRPESPLSTFKNEAGGTWTITVTDTTTGLSVDLPYARIESLGPKAQKKVLKPKLATYNPTLFAPTVVAGGTTQTLTTPLLTVAPTLIAPEVIGAQTLTTPLLTVAPTLFAPELRHQVVVPLLTVAPTLFAPNVLGTQTLTTPLLTVTPQFFGPAVNPRDVYLLPPLLDVEPTLYAPKVAQRLSLPLLTVDPALYEPTLKRDLVVPLLDVAPQLFEPTLRQGVLLPLLTVDPTLFEPTVRLRLVVPLLTVDPALYAPGVVVLAVTLTAPLLDVDPSTYPPVVRMRLLVPLIDEDDESYGPRLLQPQVFRIFRGTRAGDADERVRTGFVDDGLGKQSTPGGAADERVRTGFVER